MNKKLLVVLCGMLLFPSNIVFATSDESIIDQTIQKAWYSDWGYSSIPDYQDVYQNYVIPGLEYSQKFAESMIKTSYQTLFPLYEKAILNYQSGLKNVDACIDYANELIEENPKIVASALFVASIGCWFLYNNGNKTQEDTAQREIQEPIQPEVIEPIVQEVDAKTDVSEVINPSIPLKNLTQSEIKALAQQMLHRGILNNSAEVIRDAIAAGADINSFKEINSYPLSFAVLMNKSEAVGELLRNNAQAVKNPANDMHSRYGQLLDNAINMGHAESVLVILTKIATDKRWIPYCEGQYHTCLKSSLEKRNVEAMIFLLKNGAQFIGKNKQLLNGRNDIKNTDSFQFCMDDIFALLESYVPADNPCFRKENDIPLSLILDLLQEFINICYDVNKIWSLYEPYKWLFRHEAILELFINNGANAHQVFKNEKTGIIFSYPIFDAIQVGNVKSVKLLLDHGAFVNQVLGNKTPIQHAIEKGRQDIVLLLLSYGAKIA
jgi:ankyrin repeat protein